MVPHIQFILIKLLFQFTIMPLVMLRGVELAISSSVFWPEKDKTRVRVTRVHRCELLRVKNLENFYFQFSQILVFEM
jgi:hypothetical protein